MEETANQKAAKARWAARSPEQRKEIGKILDQIRTNQIKRKGSSNNKIYYNGLKQEAIYDHGWNH